jgi:integrase
MGRRTNGEGSITLYRDGRWCGRYTIHTLKGPKRKAIYGKTKAEVRKKLTKAIADRDNGLVFDAGNLTVEEYLLRWLNDSVKASVKQRTFECYEGVVRNHLVPAFGSKRLDKLSPALVQCFYQQKLDSGLGRRTVQLIHVTLHKALKQAVRWGIVPRNATEAVDVPRPHKKAIQPLSPKQANTFLRVAKEDRLEVLYVLAITTGLRRGELVGLRWQDVDLEAKMVSVCQQLVRSKDGLHFTTPKNGKGRNVAITDRTVEALNEHGKRQAEEKKMMENLWQETGLVFTSAKGTVLDADNLVKRSFKPLLGRAGLPDMRFHDLRHTCATLLLSKGIHPKIVQELLGHSSISITLDTYSHCLPNMQDKAVRAMDEIFDPP